MFLLGAIACFVVQKNGVDKAAETAHWPNTSGKVIECSVLYGQGFDGKPLRNRGGILDLAYEYRVGNRPYVGSDYWVWGPIPKNEQLEKIVKEHPPGTDTQVYYDPKNPENSCLERGASVADPLKLAIWSSGALLAVGLFSAWLAYMIPPLPYKRRP